MSIFVSYAKEDFESAELIFHFLDKNNLDPWLDEFSLVAGENWEIAIESAIENSRFFIVLISTTSVTKTGVVQKELKFALKRLELFPESNIFVIPVRIEECFVNNRTLRQLHYIDMFPNWQSGEDKILAAIHKFHYQDKNERNKKNMEILLTLAEIESKKVLKEGWTNLMIHAFEGEINLVQFWVDNGADVNARNNSGDTALTLAFCKNKTDVADCLLKNGINIDDDRLYHGWSYLRWAVYHEAFEDGGVEMVKLILDYGANADEIDESSGYFSALHEAASMGSLDVVKLLINRGVKIDRANKNGETALLKAAGFSHIDVIRFLLESDADFFHKNNEGKDVLDIARQDIDDYGEGLVEYLTQWEKT